MARHPLLNSSAVPDSSGNVWAEPYTVAATNDVWGALIWRFKDTSTRIGLKCFGDIPSDYNGGTTNLIVVWTSTATSGDVEWDMDYRAVGGNDSESLDQSGTQESVNNNDTAPGAAHRRLECSIALTSSNLAANDTLEFELFRDGTDGGDTMAADALLFGLYLEYTP